MLYLGFALLWVFLSLLNMYSIICLDKELTLFAFVLSILIAPAITLAILLTFADDIILYKKKLKKRKR